MFKQLFNIRNSFDFFLRRVFRFSRRGFYIENEPKDKLFYDLSKQNRQKAVQKEAEYLKKYYLQQLKDHSTVRNYLENLYTIELLESFLDISEDQNNIRILDIGSKNWFYVSGEYSFFKYSNNSERDIKLNGIEIDAYRLYTSLYSRYDAAKFYTRNLQNTEYIAGDFLLHKEKYDYMVWILPFLTREPLLHWGLPLKYLKPKEMIRHAFNQLNDDGKIIIVNQGSEEFEIQKKLLLELSIPFEEKGLFKSSFVEYENERFVSVIGKI